MRFIRVSGKNALIHSLHGLRVDLGICEAEMVLQTNFEKAVCNEFLKKSLQGDWYIAGKSPRLKYCLKNNQLAEKQTSEGNCETLMIIFKPRALCPAGYASNPERASFTESSLFLEKDKIASDSLCVIAAKQMQAN